MGLKEIRKQKELSQSELAKISKVSIKTIQAYEQNIKNINNAKLETLLKLSNALCCKVEDLLTDDKLKILISKCSTWNS